MIKKDNRKLQITVPKDIIPKLERVYQKYRVNKSSAIYTLIVKYLEKEYGDLSEFPKKEEKSL